jgi:hypothetical protein
VDQHGCTTADLLRLGDVVGQHPVRQVAHVSNGPWYGFNGVQALVLTDHALYRVPQGFALRANRVIDTFALSDLAGPRWEPRPDGRSGRLSFTVAGSRRSYVSRWSESEDLVRALATASSSDQRT